MGRGFKLPGGGRWGRGDGAKPRPAVAIAMAVLVSNLASLDGRSDWLEGVLLLAAYLILAAGFFFQSPSIA